MLFNARGLAGTVAILAIVGLAGCDVITALDVPVNGTASPRPSATATPQPGASAGTASSPAPAASAAVGYKCETPAVIAATEGNLEFATAQAVSACSTITAQFGGQEDRYFKIAIPAGAHDGYLKVTIDESDSDYTPELRFFNASKTELRADFADDGTTTPFVAQQAVTAGKDYYVRLTQPQGISQLKLRFEFGPVADLHERNDSFDTAKALSSGQATNVTTFAGVDTLGGDDEDFFKLDVPAGKTKVEVKILNKSTASVAQSFEVRLFKANKEEQDAAFSPNDQADLEETFTVETAGTYYLKVKSNNNSATASQLTVTVK